MRVLQAKTPLQGTVEILVRVRGTVVQGEVDGQMVYALIGGPVGRERCTVEANGKTCEALVLSDVEALGLSDHSTECAEVLGVKQGA